VLIFRRREGHYDQAFPGTTPQHHSAVLALAGAFCAVAPSAASAATGLMLQDQTNKYCLDGTISTITVQPCNPNDNHQRWDFVTTASGYTMFKNVYNGYCVDGTLADVYPNATCNGNDEHQEWFYLEVIGSVEDPADCLDGTWRWSTSRRATAATSTSCGITARRLAHSRDTPPGPAASSPARLTRRRRARCRTRTR
jgi:hypothetical protein